MRLVVCALADAAREAERARPAAMVSLVSPGQPDPPDLGAPARLILRFHDVTAPAGELVPPDGQMLARLLAFAGTLPGEATVLVHCWMGISRGPAAAFVLACAARPERPEGEIAAALRAASPSATPNALVVRLADAALARRGRMNAAMSVIGRGAEAPFGRPFVLRP
jgi:predicted protein tyrosine phosphatase